MTILKLILCIIIFYITYHSLINCLISKKDLSKYNSITNLNKKSYFTLILFFVVDLNNVIYHFYTFENDLVFLMFRVIYFSIICTLYLYLFINILKNIQSNLDENYFA